MLVWSWDPSFYYAQLRSPIIDRDLDFRGETQTGQVELKLTETGLQGSLWPLGPSLAWIPFFLNAHLWAYLWPEIPKDGLSIPYITLVSLGTVVYSVIGCVICYKTSRMLTNSYYALMTSLLCLFATPLFFYTFRQPIMAHGISFFVVACLVWVYLQFRQLSYPHRNSGLLFGLLLGLCFLMRWNGLLLSILPASYFLEQICQARSCQSWQMTRKIVQQIVIAGLTFLLTISPQLALWERLYASWWRIPQGAEFFTNTLLPIHFIDVLFSTNRGLLFWSPFALISIIGLFWIPEQVVRWVFIVAVTSQLLLFGYRHDWYGGGGFGSRYIVDVLPLLVVGFAALVRRLWQLRSLVGFCFTIVLVLHQLTLVFAVEHGVNGWVDLATLRQGQPIGISWQWDVFMHLVMHPLDWFLPRPYVGIDRQTLITSWLYGLSISPISSMALLIAIIFVILGLLLSKQMKRVPTVLSASVVVSSLVGCALYLLWL